LTAAVATLRRESFRSCSEESPSRWPVRRVRSSTSRLPLQQSIPRARYPTASTSSLAPLPSLLPPPACAARILQERGRCERHQECAGFFPEPICPCLAPSQS